MNSMSSVRTRMRAGLLVAFGALALLVPAGSASAVKLKGHWAPVNRCPVDNPAVVGADGVNEIAICVASSSPNGSIKLGKMETTATGATDMQFALVTSGDGTFTAISPEGGAILSEPTKVKGGLLNISCGEGPDPLAIRAICRTLIEDSPLNKVTATVESAGPISDFDLLAGLSEGLPILTLPVKIKLNNPLLGNNCYIGSNENPIVLQPANTDLTNVQVLFGSFDPLTGEEADDGEMGLIGLSGAIQGDSDFEVPKAKGCGLLNIFDGAINQRVGLPAAAGVSELVLNDASTSMIGINDPTPYAPNAGQQLNEWWHGAVLP